MYWSRNDCGLEYGHLSIPILTNPFFVKWYEVTNHILVLLQYKFYVDGEWRHDERQPFVMGNYGLVNTLLLPSDVEQVAPALSPSTGGSNNANRMAMQMDVDNDFPRSVSTLFYPCFWRVKIKILFLYSIVVLQFISFNRAIWKMIIFDVKVWNWKENEMSSKISIFRPN